MSSRLYFGIVIGIVAAALLGAGCGPSEEEKRAQQVREQLRLLEEQVTALEEENAGLKASVAQIQGELDQMNVELAAQSQRVARLKSTVGLMQEQPKSLGLWKWLGPKLYFLFKLAVVLGLVWGLYYFFIGQRRHPPGQEFQRVPPNQGSNPAQGGPGAGPPASSSGAADPGSGPNLSAASGIPPTSAG